MESEASATRQSVRESLVDSKVVLTSALETLTEQLDAKFGMESKAKVAPAIEVTIDTIAPAVEWSAETIASAKGALAPALATADELVDSVLAHPSIAPTVTQAKSVIAPLGAAVDEQLGSGSSSRLVSVGALVAVATILYCLLRRRARPRPAKAAVRTNVGLDDGLGRTGSVPFKVSESGMVAGLKCKTYFNGRWHDGNIAIMGAADQATWLSSSVFDGARYYDGACPDLDAHMKRIVRSATNMAMVSPLTAQEIIRIAIEGILLFPPSAELYIRPLIWSTGFGAGFVAPKADSCAFSMCIEELPMSGASKEQAMTVTPLLRKCSLATAPTDAKATCLYPQYGRMAMEALGRGFNVALALDANGNVCETHNANVFMVRDGVVYTPVPNGCFLAGITRRRVIELLRDAHVTVVEQTLTPVDFAKASEIFLTGNAFKVQPIAKFESNALPCPGPMAAKAKAAYAAWAKTQTLTAVAKAQGLTDVADKLEASAKAALAAVAKSAQADGPAKSVGSRALSCLVVVLVALLYLGVCIGALVAGSHEPLPATRAEALTYVPRSLGFVAPAQPTVQPTDPPRPKKAKKAKK